MKVIKEILELINLEKETKVNMESLVVGNKEYYIFYLNNRDKVIKNKIISNIILNNFNYYFFATKGEMDEFIDYIDDESQKISFIFIG